MTLQVFLRESDDGSQPLVGFNTTNLPEGSNLYHTTPRAAAAAPVQSVAGRTGAVTLAVADVSGAVSQTALDSEASARADGDAARYTKTEADARYAQWVRTAADFAPAAVGSSQTVSLTDVTGAAIGFTLSVPATAELIFLGRITAIDGTAKTATVLVEKQGTTAVIAGGTLVMVGDGGASISLPNYFMQRARFSNATFFAPNVATLGTWCSVTTAAAFRGYRSGTATAKMNLDPVSGAITHTGATYPTNNQSLGVFEGWGLNETGVDRRGGYFNIQTTEAHSATVGGAKAQIGVTRTGTTSLPVAFEVSAPAGGTAYMADLPSATSFYAVNGTQVLSARQTGWTAGTGTQNKGTFNADATYPISSTQYSAAEVQALSAAVTTLQQRVLALEAALRTHGQIN